jgi:hypothetical protein
MEFLGGLFLVLAGRVLDAVDLDVSALRLFPEPMAWVFSASMFSNTVQAGCTRWRI